MYPHKNQYCKGWSRNNSKCLFSWPDMWQAWFLCRDSDYLYNTFSDKHVYWVFGRFFMYSTLWITLSLLKTSFRCQPQPPVFDLSPIDCSRGFFKDSNRLKLIDLMDFLNSTQLSDLGGWEAVLACQVPEGVNNCHTLRPTQGVGGWGGRGRGGGLHLPTRAPPPTQARGQEGRRASSHPHL